MRQLLTEVLLYAAIFCVVRFGLIALSVDPTVATLVAIVAGSAFAFSTGFGRRAISRSRVRRARPPAA